MTIRRSRGLPAGNRWGVVPLPVLVTAVGLLALPAGTAAQAAPPRTSAADSARLAQADSTRARILQRLERLGRPLGSDTLLFLQDSLAREERAGRGPTPAGPDSVLSALLAMPGFAVTEYEGGNADFGAADRALVLQAREGARARVRREGMEVDADSTIRYSEVTGRVQTVGASAFVPETGDRVEASALVYDLAGARGSAFDARSSWEQGGAKWFIRGDMPLAAADSSFMTNAIFTSCDLEVPHYHFEADQIKIIGRRVLVARPVRLYFADVPVAWLPFIAQSLSTGRASGLLTPRFSVNDVIRNSAGYQRRLSNLGFYWAMSDYSDAVVALDWFSDNFTSLSAGVNYKLNRHFLDGSLNVRQYWRREGSTEFAVDTRHSWSYDERTQVRISGRYATSTAFIRENSFNPAEVTQSIDSEGGANRRFGWGSLALSANRRQYMSDDRVEWTLPAANLSLSTLTLFRAPPNRARAWNNMTVGGSASFNRRTVDRMQADTFNASGVNTENQDASVRSTLSMGNLALSQSVELRQSTAFGIPEAYLLLRDSADRADLVTGAPARSVTDQELRWTLSLGYMQQLVGSTTLTPSLSLSGNSFASDTSALASSFVGAPARVSLGVNLKTDLYGFFPGFGSYERIRHKVSPSFSYDWSPESRPTDLQRQVFGSRARALRPTSGLAVTLNQTFEAKRATSDTAEAGSPGAEAGSPGAPRSAPRAEISQLLGLRTSMIQYDFLEADSLGSFLAGFQTTRLSNQISSDFLQGLSLSVDHDLFEDVRGGDGSIDRTFKPHLAQVNLAFSLGSNSGIFRLLGLGGGGAGTRVPEAGEQGEGTVVGPRGVDESSIIPTDTRGPLRPDRAEGGGSGWQANLSYAMQRPRDGEGRSGSSQMLNGTLTLRPTENWDVSWRTAFDLERGAFNDHSVRLSRDLHRWQANFDFFQTATGNWQFRFEVSLIDNRELKFDYQQRGMEGQGRRDGFR